MKDEAHRVEALTYSDSYDSLVDRRFHGRPFHKVEDTGPYNVKEMVEKFGSKLIRSRQEYLQSPSGLNDYLEWASLCFELEQDVFATILAKGNAGVRGYSGQDEYKVTITADSPTRAAKVMLDLRHQFLPQENTDNGDAAFFIMTGARRAQRAVLDKSHLLDSTQLALHYGEDFVRWSSEFCQNLAEPGISILRGEAGTGKTSFLRHAMCTLSKTHRFYFVPVDNFGLLASGSLADFWKVEQREFPSASKVLVLEDAETLLLERDHQKQSPVAALLNLTDGLMTQLVKLHIICTLNSKIDSVDPALLRPGRLRFFRSFERISLERAQLIARHYNLNLQQKSDFTLAEIFASADFSANTAGLIKDKGPVGFAR